MAREREIKRAFGDLAFKVMPNPGNPRECPIPGVLQELGAERLRGFLSALWELRKLGMGEKANCHDVASMLMLDLAMSGRAEGWAWATGSTKSLPAPEAHSWVEFSGWTMEAVKQSPGDPFLLCCDVDVHTEIVEPSTVVRRDARETAAKLLARRQRMEKARARQCNTVPWR